MQLKPKKFRKKSGYYRGGIEKDRLFVENGSGRNWLFQLEEW